MKILVAEDNSDTAGFISRGLRELGHNVVTTADGIDAMHLLSTEQFDVAVLDRMLPRLDGLSIVRRARAAEIHAPVLLLTALGRIEDRVSGLEAGADDYLVKPFAFSELSARVNALARRKPLKAEPTRLELKGTHRRPAETAGSPRWRFSYLATQGIPDPGGADAEEGKVVTRTMLSSACGTTISIHRPILSIRTSAASGPS